MVLGGGLGELLAFWATRWKRARERHAATLAAICGGTGTGQVAVEPVAMRRAPASCSSAAEQESQR